MSVFEWILMFCMMSIAVCAIVFPILFLAQRKHHHKEWIRIWKEEKAATQEENVNEEE